MTPNAFARQNAAKLLWGPQYLLGDLVSRVVPRRPERWVVGSAFGAAIYETLDSRWGKLFIPLELLKTIWIDLFGPLRMFSGMDRAPGSVPSPPDLLERLEARVARIRA